MSKLVLSGDTSGSVTLDAPAVSGTTTLTLPTITSKLAINGPAFYASKTSTQTLSAATFTKVTFNSEMYDTNNNFSSSTFTPNVAGYYQISCGLYTAVNTLFIIQAYKNNIAVFEMLRTNASTSGTTGGGSGLIYCNGTTDYIEIFAYLQAGGNVGVASDFAWFSAAMVRSA